MNYILLFFFFVFPSDLEIHQYCDKLKIIWILNSYFKTFIYLSSSCRHAWKSMIGSDSFVQAGWVHDMRLFKYKTRAGVARYVVIGKVKHSQRMSATPLLPWFIAEKCGEIIAAHCTCMAG